MLASLHSSVAFFGEECRQQSCGQDELFRVVSDREVGSDVLVSVLRSDGRGGHGAAENVLIQLQEAAGAGSPLPAPGQPGAPPGSGQGRFYHAVDDER